VWCKSDCCLCGCSDPLGKDNWFNEEHGETCRTGADEREANNPDTGISLFCCGFRLVTLVRELGIRELLSERLSFATFVS
jgi:hypothetical protein